MVSESRIKRIVRESIDAILREDGYDDELQSKINDSDSEYEKANKACGDTHRAVKRIANQQQRLSNWRKELPIWKQLTSQKKYLKLKNKLHNNLKDELNKNNRAAITRDQEMLRGGNLKSLRDGGIRIGNLNDF